MINENENESSDYNSTLHPINKKYFKTASNGIHSMKKFAKSKTQNDHQIFSLIHSNHLKSKIGMFDNESDKFLDNLNSLIYKHAILKRNKEVVHDYLKDFIHLNEEILKFKKIIIRLDKINIYTKNCLEL
jgi:hypothetical protein